MIRCLAALAAVCLLAGCPSSRLLRVENKMLTEENASLSIRVAELERNAPDPTRFISEVDLASVSRLLDMAGISHSRPGEGSHLLMPHSGDNADFNVGIQYFAGDRVVFLATTNYLKLEDAQSTESVVLLLVQLATLNFEMTLGKFQLNPETGEILLSTEIHVGQGLHMDTLMQALIKLTSTADARYPQLERAIAGVGL